MIILDNLAYQHRDEWVKLGFTICDIIGKNVVQLGTDNKIVICRPVEGVTPDYQLYDEMEGANSSLLPPLLVREQMADVPVLKTIDEVIERANQKAAPPPPDFGPQNEEREEGGESAATQGVDTPFL